MEDLLRTPLYRTLRTNQMGYIKVKAQLPGIYGNVNRPCPRAAPSDSGRFTAINPWRLGFNYYLLLYSAVLHILNIIPQYMIVCIWSVWPSVVKGRSVRHKEEGVEVKNELMNNH